MKDIINRYADALLASAHAEGSAQLHLVAKAVFVDEVLQSLHYLT